MADSTTIAATVTAGNGGTYRILYDRPGPTDQAAVEADLLDLGCDLAAGIAEVGWADGPDIDHALLACSEWVNPRHASVLAMRDGVPMSTIGCDSLTEALTAWALIDYDEADPAAYAEAIATLRALAASATIAADRLQAHGPAAS